MPLTFQNLGAIQKLKGPYILIIQSKWQHISSFGMINRQVYYMHLFDLTVIHSLPFMFGGGLWHNGVALIEHCVTIFVSVFVLKIMWNHFHRWGKNFHRFYRGKTRKLIPNTYVTPYDFHQLLLRGGKIIGFIISLSVSRNRQVNFKLTWARSAQVELFWLPCVSHQLFDCWHWIWAKSWWNLVSLLPQ